jgi:enamine deaminase RidA (YjgF/YER057c/UK114 family)
MALTPSGIAASDVPGGAAAHGDVARETEIVMITIREALAQVGVGMERIVRADVHLIEIARIPDFDQVYARFFPNGALPARTCTQSGGSGRRIEPRDHGHGAAVIARIRPRCFAT